MYYSYEVWATSLSGQKGNHHYNINHHLQVESFEAANLYIAENRF
jgi:hypothetical protein